MFSDKKLVIMLLIISCNDLVGWDEGVLGMQVGEVARLTVSVATLLFLYHLCTIPAKEPTQPKA